MGLIRFILIACVIYLVFLIIRKLRQKAQDRQQHVATQKQVVQCASCGVYVPKEEALYKSEQYFCCRSHMETERKEN